MAMRPVPASVILAALLCLSFLVSCSKEEITPRATAFERTEAREPCASYDPLRQPFFGETHLHTGLSFDASFRFVRPLPRDAYRFAKGGSVVGVGPDGFPTRIYTQDRPLDFAAVTDHSEHFGEMGVCKSADLPGRFSLECQLLNGFYWQPGHALPAQQRELARNTFSLIALPNLLASSFNSRLPICVNGEANCLESEQQVWHEMQAAAEEA